MNRPDQVAFGQRGAKLTTTALVDAPSGKAIVAITVLSDDQTVTATSEDTDTWASLAIAIPKGVTVFGRFTDIKTTNANGAIYYLG